MFSSASEIPTSPAQGESYEYFYVDGVLEEFVTWTKLDDNNFEKTLTRFDSDGSFIKTRSDKYGNYKTDNADGSVNITLIYYEKDGGELDYT